MAHEGRDARRPRREKHGWNSFENYQAVHEGSLARHAFVVADKTQFSRTRNRDGSESVLLEGRVECVGGLVIEVTKLLEVRTDRRRVREVRGVRYRYHAHCRGRNLLRYDNYHSADEFDRHRYDYESQGQEIEIIERADLPTLIEIVDEVEQTARRYGLIP